jgi:hypothetical protein
MATSRSLVPATQAKIVSSHPSPAFVDRYPKTVLPVEKVHPTYPWEQTPKGPHSRKNREAP